MYTPLGSDGTPTSAGGSNSGSWWFKGQLQECTEMGALLTSPDAERKAMVANLLTGDFAAVIQVSENTLNRLVASMHQNYGGNPAVPSIQHSVTFRVEDEAEAAGLQGTAWTQVGVPRVTLLDRAVDRFAIEAALRIMYIPDSETRAPASFVQGTFRAQCTFEDIDPDFLGWRKLASQYAWIRVVEDSVSFDCSISDDPWLEIPRVDRHSLATLVAAQIRTVLRRSGSLPHPTRPSFRRGSFISLVQKPGSILEAPLTSLEVPVGGSALTAVVSMADSATAGDLNSLHIVMLGKRDFALAINVDTVMALIEPTLDAIRATTQNHKVTVGCIDATYELSVDSVATTWQPHDSFAVVIVHVEGAGHTDSVLPDVSFNLDQRLHLSFDPARQIVHINGSGNNLTVTAEDGELPPNAIDTIRSELSSAIESVMASAAGALQPSMTRLTSGQAELVTQLRSIDAQAAAHLDDASFYLSGIVLRGSIFVSPRRRPVNTFLEVDSDTFSAFDTWLPGGSVEKLTWSWTWANSSRPAGEAIFEDRFVLRHQPSDHRARFGLGVGSQILPGLDGSGKLCLSVEGFVVDTTTGDLVRVLAGPHCVRFGYIDMFTPQRERLFVRQWTATPGEPPAHEVGLLDVSSDGEPTPGSPNTLLVHLGDGTDESFPAIIRAGLRRRQREDAGLFVLVLLAEQARKRVPYFAHCLEELDAPVIVSEDVDGVWSRAFDMAHEDSVPAWRLLSPAGRVVWTHDEAVDAEQLGRVLQQSLSPSVAARPTAFNVDLGPRLRSSEGLGVLFDPPHGDRSICPRWRGLRVDVCSLFASVCFVRKDSESSAERLEQLQAAHANRAEADAGVIVVVDGATPHEAKRLNDALGPVFTVVGDSEGARARAVGVRFWPTTVNLQNPPRPFSTSEGG